MQTTLIIIKPDAVQRGLTGELLSRYERKGLQIVAAKFIQVSEEIASKHYAEHKEKPFFGELIGFITAAPVMVAAVRGPEAIAICRKINGATNGVEADPGTIRGDYAVSKQLNLVHASDSPESAERELALWFNGEIIDWSRQNERWITG
ncbi:MAG: nucleoside-diphosphate kinase [Phycisphaera sp.]|nr:nucleoside-diphosphate kinase [Phycisphaera sp.]